jgi:hypothetical protein
MKEAIPPTWSGASALSPKDFCKIPEVTRPDRAFGLAVTDSLVDFGCALAPAACASAAGASLAALPAPAGGVQESRKGGGSRKNQGYEAPAASLVADCAKAAVGTSARTVMLAPRRRRARIEEFLRLFKKDRAIL